MSGDDTQTGPRPAAGDESPHRPEGAAPLRLAVIVGSVREGRFGPTVSHWVAETARAYGRYDVDLIDLAEAEHVLPVAFPDFAAPPSPDVERVRDGLSRRLAAADAFVVVTPEYNHSYPAPLKNTIDWFRSEWYAKPVALVSYGGMAGGQRAAEHLRQVFPELHAVTIRDTLAFPMAWDRFDENGRPRDEEGTGAAAKQMLRQLEWWGDALRDARARTPYSSVA